MVPAIRSRLGPTPKLVEAPLVSIVVLSRDGEAHLRRLLAGLVERTDYPSLELVVVDNGSSDGSLDFLRSAEAPFPVSILANHHNESFSDANNQGAELASGELLLFMNNDVEPIEPGWLRELVACLGATGAGAANATLITPSDEQGPDSGYRVQTLQARLRKRSGILAVGKPERSEELFGEGFGETVDSVLAIAACTLIERTLFERIGGFTHGYFYGGEDTDLFLKVRERGLSILACGRAILAHRGSATRQGLIDDDNGFRPGGNFRLVLERWGPRVWREYELDRLAGGGLWAERQEPQPDPAAREQALRLGFCLKADGLPAGSEGLLEGLRGELTQRSHRCFIPGDDPIDELRGLYFDVAVHMRGVLRHLPKPAQLNVLWALGEPTALSAIECRRYDLVLCESGELAARLAADSRPTPVVALERGREAEQLIEATQARAAEVGFPTRVEA